MSVHDAVAAIGGGRPTRGSLRVQLVNCYISAATDVLAQESGSPVERGGLQLEGEPYTSDDVTAMVGISGDLAGSFYLSMSAPTALAIVSRMLGQPATEFDELAQSGIAEMANVIAGTAGALLAQMGRTTGITPPLLLVGSGARLSSVEIQRVVVVLRSTCGDVNIHVAVREA